MNGAAFICISNSKGWHRGSGGYNKHSLHSGPALYLWACMKRHYVAMISCLRRGQEAVIYMLQLQNPTRIYHRGCNYIQGLVMDYYWIILVLTLSYRTCGFNEKTSYGFFVNAKLISN